jgi:hypothetical protein
VAGSAFTVVNVHHYYDDTIFWCDTSDDGSPFRSVGGGK